MSELEAACERLHIRARAEYGKAKGKKPDRMLLGTHPWRVRLRRPGRQLTVDFFTGPACKGEPTAADVLSCLISEAAIGGLSFSEFCSELGYNEDSRKAEALWRECKKIAPRVKRFCGSDWNVLADATH